MLIKEWIRLIAMNAGFSFLVIHFRKKEQADVWVVESPVISFRQVVSYRKNIRRIIQFVLMHRTLSLDRDSGPLGHENWGNPKSLTWEELFYTTCEIQQWHFALI